MKQLVIWLARRTGAYNEIYMTGWRNAGHQMTSDRLWWHQSKLPYRNAIANAFHLYSKSLFFGCVPNMTEVRAEVEKLGTQKHDEIKSVPYVKDVERTKVTLVKV